MQDHAFIILSLSNLTVEYEIEAFEVPVQFWAEAMICINNTVIKAECSLIGY